MANSRAKGKRGELEVANLLKGLGYDAKRGVQYQGGPDSPDVTGLPHVHIEVKRVQELRLYKAIEQSKRDAAEDEYPVVIHRRDRQSWVVIQPFEDWLELYESAEELYRQSGKEAEQSMREFTRELSERLCRDRMVR